MVTAPVSYIIDTVVPPSYFEKLFDFIYRLYFLPRPQRFSNLAKDFSSTHFSIGYVVVDDRGKAKLKVQIEGTNAINVNVTPLAESVSEGELDEARQDVFFAVKMFEAKAQGATWYFAWRDGENIVPEKVRAHEKSFNRIFMETQVLLFLSFIVLGMGLFVVVYSFYPSWVWIAPLILIGFQFLLVFYSNKIISRTADWTITKENPFIHLLEYRLPTGGFGAVENFKQSPEQLVAIKNEVYQEILAKKGAIDCTEAHKVFEKYSVSCQPDNLSAKKVNVYELVQKVAGKFGYKVPKIVVSNTMVPNAAASGPSPRRGVVLITTGLLVQLDEAEVVSVLGHEFGHLKGRDPLVLFGLTSAEFLFRFYVLLNLFPIIFGTYLFFIYFWAIMTLIFFIAKFFEFRADLTSAIKIGQPKVLAGALEKIGFHRLISERAPAFRIQEWVSLDSHPPIYFRIQQLSKLKEPTNIKHTLTHSIKEVLRGFAASIQQ